MPVPQPLRSTREPQGLSTLSGADLVRVQLANSLCRAVGRIVCHCLSLGVRVTVENPKNSLAWLTTCSDNHTTSRFCSTLACTDLIATSRYMCLLIVVCTFEPYIITAFGSSHTQSIGACLNFSEQLLAASCFTCFSFSFVCLTCIQKSMLHMF